MEGARTVLVLAIASAAALVTVLVAETPLTYVWWMIAPGLATGAVALGVVRFRPARRAPWIVLLIGMSLLWVGWSISGSLGLGLLDGPSGEVATVVRDAIYVVAYPALGVASWMMVRVRTGGRDHDDAIDALLVMVALATGLGAWLFGERFDVGISALDRTWVTFSPLVLAAVVTANVRVLFAAGGRLPAAWLLFGGGLFALLGNLWTAQLLRDGLDTQVTGIDVLWILGFVAVATAALDPSMRHLTDPVARESLLRGMPVDRLVLLGASLLAAPISLLRAGGHRTETVLIVLGGVVVAVLAVWRVARLLAERDVARRALQEVARRDAVVATIGRLALDDLTTWELLAAADELLDDAFADVTCTVVPTGVDDPPYRPGAALATFPIDDGAAEIARIVAVVGSGRPGLVGERDLLTAVAGLLTAAAVRRAGEAKLRHDVMHDPLTGLPNRTLAIDRLEQLLSHADVTDVTVVFVDLDGFKAVNDTLGHAAGDAVLVDIADRLRAVVGEAGTVARFAGDEFVVLVRDTDQPGAQELVERLLDAASVALPNDGVTLQVSASIGVASAAPGSADAVSLLRQADHAMYRAKDAGGGEAAWAHRPDPALPWSPARSVAV